MWAKCERVNPLVHLLANIFLSHALQTRVEPQVFLHTQLVKQNIVLGTHAQILPDALHLCADVMAVYGGRARSGWKQSCENGPMKDSLDNKYIFCRTLQFHTYIQFSASRVRLSASIKSTVWVQRVSTTLTHYEIQYSNTHIVVVLPAPLCPKKETTWFS